MYRLRRTNYRAWQRTIEGGMVLLDVALKVDVSRRVLRKLVYSRLAGSRVRIMLAQAL